MYISLSKIEGDVESINILNHYIGMKAISPESIPELKIMPYVVGGLIALGLLTVFFVRRWLAAAWFLLLLVTAALGLYDFYQWEYDYGHNLDPQAPIIVPGMTYQPPFIGKKTLLNFEAYSYPDIGGISLGLAAVCIFLSFSWAYFAEKFRRRRTPGAMAALFLALLCLACAGCPSKPEAIQVNVDSCAVCKMQITDLRFGGEILTGKGRIYKFDSISCLRDFYNTEKEVKAVWVQDYFAPGILVEVSKASFLSSARIRAPMGVGIVASANEAKLKELQKELQGELLSWPQVVSGGVSGGSGKR